MNNSCYSFLDPFHPDLKLEALILIFLTLMINVHSCISQILELISFAKITPTFSKQPYIVTTTSSQLGWIGFNWFMETCRRKSTSLILCSYVQEISHILTLSYWWLYSYFGIKGFMLLISLMDLFDWLYSKWLLSLDFDQ